MEIQLIDKDKEQNSISFLLKNTTASFANALRRIMISEVPTMAIEEVEFRHNDSALYDEALAHRLGLLVIKTDLKSYNKTSDCNCNDEGCARCQLKFTLKAKGDKMIYASDLNSQDPKVKPVHPKSIIVRLLKGQNIEFEARATVNNGKTHMKWSPGTVHFKNKPKITINTNSSELNEFKESYPDAIFDKNGKIDKNAILSLNLVDACDGICDDIIKIEYDDTAFEFIIESWGQLDHKEIINQASEILEAKTEDFIEKVKQL